MHLLLHDVDNRICAKGYLSGWISFKLDLVKISFSYVLIYQINEFLILNVVLVKLDWLLEFNNKKNISTKKNIQRATIDKFCPVKTMYNSYMLYS